MMHLLALPLVSCLLAGNGFLEALEKASKGEWTRPAVVEVSGFYQGRFQNFTFFGNGVGIRDGREQVRLTNKQITQVFRELRKARFTEMPESFGGKPRPTNRPEVRSMVRLRLGDWGKTVMQMRDGEQSSAFRRLVERLLHIAAEVPAGLTAPPGWEALRWVAEGKLAPETLRLELALETSPKRFMTFSVLNGWYALALGDGNVEEGWLTPTQLLQLAKTLGSLEGQRHKVHFTSEYLANLRVGVLGSSVEVVGMKWAGANGEEKDPFKETWGQVEEHLKVFVKELRRPSPS
ncbi:MAG: hypothetical protein ACUVRY_09295 [Thermoanaerobaculaceae bacterium]